MTNAGTLITCKICDRLRPRSQFYVTSIDQSGRRGLCKDCEHHFNGKSQPKNNPHLIDVKLRGFAKMLHEFKLARESGEPIPDDLRSKYDSYKSKRDVSIREYWRLKHIKERRSKLRRADNYILTQSDDSVIHRPDNTASPTQDLLSQFQSDVRRLKEIAFSLSIDLEVLEQSIERGS